MVPKATLGLVAGSGQLPARVVAACLAEERPVFVLALEGHADPALVKTVPHVWRRLGTALSGIDAFRDAGVTELVMAGAVRRPTVFELRPDLRTARFFARIGVKALGDDGLLRAVMDELEREGFRVIGVDQVLGDLMATAGVYGRIAPDAVADADIRRGAEVARGLGALDVGQGAVVQQGIVLAVEAVEGTDVMLSRCRALHRSGPGGVLVKVRKPGQDRRADLPTIGTDTVRRAAEAGLRGIAVQAGGALILDGAAVVREADDRGLFVVGVDLDSDPVAP